MRKLSRTVLFATTLPLAAALAAGAPDSWAELPADFPSTGGGGVMIRDYRPTVVGATCVTDFRAVTPDGTTYFNAVTFDAAPYEGGILCTNGRWRSLTGPATGTTTLVVFIKDGVVRRAP